MSGDLTVLCTGTASLELWSLGGPNYRPEQPCGFMGSKRRWASALGTALGFARSPPDRVLTCDAGPWGDVWTVLRERESRREVEAVFRFWKGRDPHALWRELVALPPDTAHPPHRVAQYLWLQARSAGTIPIWFNWSYRGEREVYHPLTGEPCGRWESPTGSRTESAHHRGGADAATRGTMDARKRGKPHRPPSGRVDGPAYEAGRVGQKRADAALQASPGIQGAHQKARSDEHAAAERVVRGRKVEGANQVDASKHEKVLALIGEGLVEAPRWAAGCRGIQYPETIADRIARMDFLPWDRVEVVHDDVRGLVERLERERRGGVVYFDPPYLDSPRYAELLSRAEVLDIAQRLGRAGYRVAISEYASLAGDVRLEEVDGRKILAGGLGPDWSAIPLSAGRTAAGGGGSRKRVEWITASWPITFGAGRQLELLDRGAA